MILAKFAILPWQLGMKWFLSFLEHEGPFSVSETEQNKVGATVVMLAVLQGSCQSRRESARDEMKCCTDPASVVNPFTFRSSQ
jgi:hypothetical protein